MRSGNALRTESALGLILLRESAPPAQRTGPTRLCQLAELPVAGGTAVELGDPPHPLVTGELADNVDTTATHHWIPAGG